MYTLRIKGRATNFGAETGRATIFWSFFRTGDQFFFAKLDGREFFYNYYFFIYLIDRVADVGNS